MALTRRKTPSFLEVEEQACKRLERGPLPPLLLITGDVPFLKRRIVEAATRAASGAADTFSQRPGERDAEAFERLLQEWTTATLFGGARLIVARDADALVARGRLGRLDAVLAQDPPHRLLLSLAALDGRTRLARHLRERGGLVALPVLRDAPPPWEPADPTRPTELHAWVEAEARRRGLQLARSGAFELVRRVGNEPAALADRLQRLRDLLGPDAAVEAADVARHVRRSSARLMARYEEELGAGRTGPALELLERMLAAGVYDHTGRLVSGDQAGDTVLRGLAARLVRLIEAHEALGAGLLAALGRRPWQRSREEDEVLGRVLGAGGRRAFLERDLRTTPLPAARRALSLALAGLRDARDGRGLSMHALTVRLAGAFAGGLPA